MTDKVFSKNWASPPGDTILDALEELGLNQRKLAVRLGVTPKHVNDLIKARFNITAEMAVKLESVLGEPASFWMKRDADYRLDLAYQEEVARASRSGAWLRQIPYGEMTRLGWVRQASTTGEKVVEALRFFGVGSVDAWQQYAQDLCPAFRDSGRFERHTGAVAAWLRQAEREAHKLTIKPFDMKKLCATLSAIRSLALECKPEIFIPRLQELCGTVGIAVVFVPAPKGCPVSGATRWLTADKALLALSLRYKSNDHLWFSLFHELGHLIKHGKRLTLIEGFDGLDPVLEEEANSFAADQLIPPDSGYAAFARGVLSDKTVLLFSKQIGIAPGIVVGRLQNDKRLSWNSPLNKHKVLYKWTAS